MDADCSRKSPLSLISAVRDRKLVPLFGVGVWMQAQIPPGEKAFLTWTEMLDEVSMSSIESKPFYTL